MSEGVKLDSLSRQVVGAAFRVGRELGPGFLEKVYELVVEVKAARSIEKQHISQCAHYLKATGSRMGLLLNFGAPSVQFRRVFHAV